MAPIFRYKVILRCYIADFLYFFSFGKMGRATVCCMKLEPKWLERAVFYLFTMHYETLTVIEN